MRIGVLMLSLVMTGASLAEDIPPPAVLDHERLETFIERGMADWQIPGLAVAVVHADEVIYQQGFGVLGLDDDRPVDNHSLFGVASTSKAMTVAALAMLVDEGKLDWDDRVIDHLPWFRLSDPWVTHEVRVRDLLTHRVGVGRMTGNRLQFMNEASPRQVIEQMRHLAFEQPFRSRYVYSNVMYSVAGQLIPAITDQSWDDFVQQRLFQPLGMTRSNTSIEQLQGDGNAAWPHQFIDGQVQSIPRRNFDNVGPAASVNSSVADMAQWMRLQLGEPGVYNGERLISEQQMNEMHQPQMAIGRDDPSSPMTAYGLGWHLSHYQGHMISQHGGASDGMNTQLVMVPGLDLGIVVVSNTFNTFRMALANTLMDAFIQPDEPKDWHQHYFDEYQQRFDEVMQQRQAIHDARLEGTEPSVEKAELVGHYHDPLYKSLDVRQTADGGLQLRFWDSDQHLADLEHWHLDTWRASWQNPARREKFVDFDFDRDGQVAAINVTFTLRPRLLQAGIYPSDYQRTVRFERVNPEGFL